jgi:hypothetical protein
MNSSYVFMNQHALMTDWYGKEELASITGTDGEMPLRHQVKADSGAHPASYLICTEESFSICRNVKLTTDRLLIQEYRIRITFIPSHLMGRHLIN